ncbi:MAG: prepilin-type N-terminal cleavage/methylation domain-containing protein [Tenericutes bacterium]|nr:prepilin-type N-terminal cleavage/methylation domain-containing protein [Mycoplasmatota bacterium]
MNKKGFTLSELLVVIAIIGVITVIAVPSIVVVNKNINKRMYSSKVSNIVSAAELYATDNPDIFNGRTEVKLYVYELIKGNYLPGEVKQSTNGECNTELSIVDSSGNNVTVQNSSECIINPVDKTSMNGNYVILRKEAVGVTAEFNGRIVESNNGVLVQQVCDRFNNGQFVGKYGENENDTCKCDSALGLVATGGTLSGQAVKACLISGNEEKNYLKYDNVMWRVMGVYNIYNDPDRLVAKMITNENVDVQ